MSAVQTENMHIVTLYSQHPKDGKIPAWKCYDRYAMDDQTYAKYCQALALQEPFTHTPYALSQIIFNKTNSPHIGINGHIVAREDGIISLESDYGDTVYIHEGIRCASNLERRLYDSKPVPASKEAVPFFRACWSEDAVFQQTMEKDCRTLVYSFEKQEHSPYVRGIHFPEHAYAEMVFQRNHDDVTLVKADNANTATLRDLNAKIRGSFAKTVDDITQLDGVCFAAHQAKIGFAHYDRHIRDPYLKIPTTA